MIELLFIMSFCTPITFDCGTLYVDEWFPSPCYKGLKEDYILAGCTDRRDIWINSTYLHTVDPHGTTVLCHEMKHIICRCNWHG